MMPQIAVIDDDDDAEEEKKEEVKEKPKPKITDEAILALPTISLAELAKHTTKTDFWTAVDGLVYDVT